MVAQTPFGEGWMSRRLLALLLVLGVSMTTLGPLAPPPAYSDEEHVIGAEDLLQIEVWDPASDKKEMDKEVPVRLDGKISFPLIGEMHDRLGALAAEQDASLIVFGSDYRTPPGHVEPGTSAQHLMDGGRVAVAIAAAGLRTDPDGTIGSIAVPLAGPVNDVARQTANSLSERLGATVVDSPSGSVDLIVLIVWIFAQN